MLINALGVFACAVSPAVVLGATVVLPRPYRVILALSSSFAFVLSFILCSLVWTVVPALRGSLLALVLYSTAIQELGRWGVYWCYVQLQEHIAAMRGIATHSLSSLSSPVDILGERFACATAMGVGIGATHTLLLTGKLYGDALQPGSVYVEQCAISRHALAALVALAFCALQVVWTIYAFTHAYPAKSKPAVALIVGTACALAPLLLLRLVYSFCELAHIAVALHWPRRPHGLPACLPACLMCCGSLFDVLPLSRTPPYPPLLTCVPSPAVSHAVASSLTLFHAAEGHPALQCGGLSLPLLYLLLVAFGGVAARTALHGLSTLSSSACP